MGSKQVWAVSVSGPKFGWDTLSADSGFYVVLFFKCLQACSEIVRPNGLTPLFLILHSLLIILKIYGIESELLTSSL